MSRPLGSQYVLESSLGRGATGEVWRGADSEGNPLAFKVLHESLASDPATVQRFLQERSILTGLDHPSLVRVRDLVAEGGTLAIAMDLVEGGDLRALLATYPVLPPAEVCRIGAEVAAGLAAVHEAGVVHRDIKPENVLLDTRVNPPAPKLTDFGIAKIAEQTGSGRSTMLVGTPRYIAPEVFDGQAPSPAADLYGLGILLYEMSCGTPPFVGDSTLAVLRQHVDYAPGRPAGIPDPLWELIWYLLAKDPAARPAPAGRVSNQLAALAQDLASAPPAPALTQPPAPTPVVVHSQPTELGAPGPTREPAAGAEAAPAATPQRRTPRTVLAALVVLALVAAGLGGWTVVQAVSSDDPGTDAASSSSPAAAAPTEVQAQPTSVPPPAPTSPASLTSPGPTASAQAPVGTLPPPPSDPGVPYESGTMTSDFRLDLDEGETNCCSADLTLTADGLAAQDGALLARWSGDELPVPSECYALPHREWILFLPPDQIDVDDTFCVITKRERYGYIEVRDRDITEEGDLRSVTVTFMVWSNPDDL